MLREQIQHMQLKYVAVINILTVFQNNMQELNILSTNTSYAVQIYVLELQMVRVLNGELSVQ